MAEREQNAKRPMPGLPEGIMLEETEFDGISGEILRPEHPKDAVIWYLHGGGFTTGSARERRRYAGSLDCVASGSGGQAPAGGAGCLFALYGAGGRASLSYGEYRDRLYAAGRNHATGAV